MFWLSVLLLLAVAAAVGYWGWRYWTTGDPGIALAGWFGPRPEPRLSVSEQASVDSRRRLVLVRRDDVEHLIMTGGPVDVVIETNIRAAVPAEAAAPAEPAAPVFSRPPRLGQAVNK
jgi:hypothetical protein